MLCDIYDFCIILNGQDNFYLIIFNNILHFHRWQTWNTKILFLFCFTIWSKQITAIKQLFAN